MTANEFVDELARAAPSLDDLMKVGMSRSQAVHFRNGFRCQKREHDAASERAHNELLRLISLWDASTVKVGMVSFFPAPVIVEDGIQVGSVEVDPLIIFADGEEVIVTEFGVHNHLLWPASESGERFLDALIFASKFLGDSCVRKIDFNDFDAARAAATECTTLAGGARYHDFYLMLLGAEP